MDKLAETIRLKTFEPTEKLPPFIEPLPKINKDTARDIESIYSKLALRMNYLLSNNLTIEAHTSDDILKENESGSVHTNLGATGTVTILLPESATKGTQKGTHYFFAVQAAQELRIDPGAAAIRDDCGQTNDKYKVADAIGECIHIVADENGDWVTISKHGTWSEEE